MPDNMMQMPMKNRMIKSRKPMPPKETKNIMYTNEQIDSMTISELRSALKNMMKHEQVKDSEED